MKHDRRVFMDRLFKYAVLVVAGLALFPLLHIAGSIIWLGGKVLLKAGPGFLYRMPPSPISNSLGGIGPSLLGTIVLMVLTTIIGLPLAFFTAVLAVEYPGSIVSKATSLITRSFIEIPTILVSMLVYTLMVIPMRSFSALAGALALAIVSLPYIYTHVENALASIPWTYREAAFSLGMTRLEALFNVFVGIARRGIIAGVLIGLAKASGETAPLLFTIGGSRHTYYRGLNKPIDAVPLLIYQFALTPYKVYHEVAWGASLILLAIYIAVFTALRSLVKEVEL